MSHFCRIFSVEISFLSALEPELDFLAWGSYAVELAHCAPPPPSRRRRRQGAFRQKKEKEIKKKKKKKDIP